ncbi:MAG: hypothetical protein AABZ12_08295 [Planctomycetota bacterium]
MAHPAQLEQNQFLCSVAVYPRRFLGSAAREGRRYTKSEIALIPGDFLAALQRKPIDRPGGWTDAPGEPRGEWRRQLAVDAGTGGQAARASGVPRGLVVLLMGCSLALLRPAMAAGPAAPRPAVELKLRTGGAVHGEVLDSTDHGLVVLRGGVPFVFAWTELDAGSAIWIRKQLMQSTRGGEKGFSAEDHFELGRFALAQGRNDLATNSFQAAEKQDRRYAAKIQAALDDFRKATRREPGPLDTPAADADEAPRVMPDTPAAADKGDAPDAPAGDDRGSDAWPDVGVEWLSVGEVPDDVREAVHKTYLDFGETVRATLGKDMVLVETEHFLIWTDWPFRDRPRLAHWSEAMYAALGAQFGLDPTERVFLAKCPMFCFRAQGRFRKFARTFDGHAASDAVGYTRSSERTGHVHVVLVRSGDSQIDDDRFAATLVHEGTHAFLHRLHAPGLIPHWVNEGLAEMMVERVLGDHGVTAENAALLARQYARHDWPIAPLLANRGPIEVHQYALAHSVVAFLDVLGSRRLADFVRHLKQGETVEIALSAAFDGLALVQLESDWRAQVRAQDPNWTPQIGSPDDGQGAVTVGP